jgi:SOS-response transcriptional repressor LexA
MRATPFAMAEDWFPRLKKAIKDDGRPHREISRAAGLGINYVGQMLDKDQPPKLATLEKLLHALGGKAAATVREGMATTLGPGMERLNTGRPTFAGITQAGLWRAVDDDFNQDTEVDIPAIVQRDPRYPKLRQYVYRNEGHSMNAAGIEDGMWIVAVDAGDFIDQVRDIESGNFVVVERTRFQGAERELTVKEIRYYRDRYELHPRSHDKAYTPIIVPHNDAPEDETEVRVVGLVLGAYRDLLSL